VSLERRVRDALDDAAQIPGPTETEARLDRVRRQGRSGRQGLVGLVAVGLVLVAAAFAIGPLVPGLAPSFPTASDPSTGPTSVSALIGTYRTTLSVESVGVEGSGMAGSWTLVIGADGSMTVEAPATFRLPHGGRPSRAIHSEEGTEFMTTLFARDLTAECATPGRYDWHLADVLSFALVADTCDERRTLLSASPWTPVRSPDG
jgi:hypothetical protein